MAAAEASGAEQLWSLGDMVGGGPDPERVVALTRERCRVALVGNHDYGATGSVDPSRLGEPGSAGYRSIEYARTRLGEPDIAWLRARKPAARRDDIQCWHGSPRNAVWEFVGPANAGACLAVQRAPLGLVAHTHVAAAWRARPGGGAERVPVAPGHPLDISDRQVAPQSGRRGRPGPLAARLVGRAGRAGRRRGVLAAARPGRAHGDLAPRAVRSRPGARPRPRARSGRRRITIVTSCRRSRSACWARRRSSATACPPLRPADTRRGRCWRTWCSPSGGSRGRGSPG